MVKKTLVRLAEVVIVMLVVSFATMLLLELVPGGPGAVLAGEGATAEEIAAIERNLNLDGPLLLQYTEWISNVVVGDLGLSYFTQRPVIEIVVERIPVTVEIAFAALAVALAMSIPLAMYCGYRPNGLIDRVTTFTSSVMLSMPHFVLGLGLVFFFSVQLGLFPVAGWSDISDGVWDHVHHLVLPVFTLAFVEASIFVRVLKNDISATLGENFILAARARGVGPWRVLWRHALRPSSFALITVIGTSLGKLLTGTVIVEIIFGLPGLGNLIVSAIGDRDLVTVRGTVLVIAFIYVFVNFVVDTVYPLLDPRLRKSVATSVTGASAPDSTP